MPNAWEMARLFCMGSPPMARLHPSECCSRFRSVT